MAFENEVGEMTQEEKDLRAELAAEVFGGEEPSREKPEIEDIPEQDEPEEREEQHEDPPVEQDPWAGVSPALREAIGQISQRVEGIDQLRSEVDVIKQAKAEQPSQEDVRKAMADDEAWKAFTEDFPTHAEAIETRINNMLGEGYDVKSLRESVRKEIQGEFEGKLDTMSKNMELKILKSKYKDHAQIVKTDKWKTWFAAQSKEDQAKYGSWSAMDAIDLLDKFHEDTKPKSRAAQRNQRLQEHAGFATGRGQATKTKSEADMTAEELYKQAASEIWEKK